MRNLLLELYRRDRALTIVGVLHLALFIALVIAATTDDRQLLGVNVWLKPIKFAISIAIYVGTLAWILPAAPGPRWSHGVIRWGVSVAMLTEMTLIAMQAARGVTSHFNETTPLDAAIFSVMGLMIGFNTCLEGLLLTLYFRRGAPLAPAYLRGIRWGLLLGIFSAVVGGVMVSRSAHTVGASDGGPGVWLLNWSTTDGDLRIAHALGLHALQILPLLGWLLSGRMSVWQSVTVVTVVAVGYSAVACLVLLEALAGQPNTLLRVFAAGA